MKNKFLVLTCVILCVVIATLALVACNEEKEPTVEIKPATTVEVGTAEELLAVSQYVGLEYSQYTIKLTADIDLSEVEWKPIGITHKKAFMGTFDGNGHKITGLTITGWDEEGNPKYIAKRILGWVDGQPIYKSSAIISIDEGEVVEENQKVAVDVIKEGDNDDPNYENLADNGTFEEHGGYGSVGLFGYTVGATVKNLTVSGADISFYSSGDYAYAGVISGYDAASTFTDVTVENSSIATSLIYDQKVVYYDYFGTPSMFSNVSETTQYVGGVVGYAKSKTTVKDGKTAVVGTTLTNVVSNSFVFDNTNYSAYYNAGLEIIGDKEQSQLVHNTGIEDGYEVTDVEKRISRGTIGSENYPVQVYTGAVAGYMDGAKVNATSVDGFNKAEYKDTTNELVNPTLLIARSLYAAGISGCLYNGEISDVDISNVFVNTINWSRWNNDIGNGLILDKATAAGAVALVGNAKITDVETNAIYFDLGGGASLSNVCVGGIAGYVYDATEISNVTVKDIFAYSNYTGGGSEEVGSILAGVVGVMRNGKLTQAKVDDAGFELSGHITTDLRFVKGVVSQLYGNSVCENSEAKNVVIYTSKIATQEYDDVEPLQYKNNYVNEDGFTSVQLYYTVNEKIAGVYVTVYGELVPADSLANALYKETVYKKVTLNYNEGDTLPLNKYYYYNSATGKYNAITANSTDNNKLYSSSRLYAEKLDVYRIELDKSNVGKTISVGTYYEYIKETGTYSLTTDTVFNADKTYYISTDASVIASYYLKITVYTESGSKIIVDKKNVDDEEDDVLAEAIYVLTKEEVDDAVTTVQCGTTTYELANSEIYLDKYFVNGTGFKADKNGFAIKYFDESQTNRDFSKYSFVSGRPVVNNVEYVID